MTNPYTEPRIGMTITDRAELILTTVERGGSRTRHDVRADIERVLHDLAICTRRDTLAAVKRGGRN